MREVIVGIQPPPESIMSRSGDCSVAIAGGCWEEGWFEWMARVRRCSMADEIVVDTWLTWICKGVI